MLRNKFRKNAYKLSLHKLKNGSHMKTENHSRVLVKLKGHD